MEGDRYEVTVKVPRAATAVRARLQRWTKDVLGNAAWVTVAVRKVRGKARQAFRAVAGEADSDRYRARVEYATGKPVMSTPDSVTVWHWVSMMEFDAYSSSNGVVSSPYAQFVMNGTAYPGGWYTSGSWPSWDLRFTPGRHCRAFRGVVGVTDRSADGSAGAFQLVADDAPVYASPVLSPGTTHPFEVELATPYRLYLQAQRLSTQAAYPAVGYPELLCTGLQ